MWGRRCGPPPPSRPGAARCQSWGHSTTAGTRSWRPPPPRPPRPPSRLRGGRSALGSHMRLSCILESKFVIHISPKCHHIWLIYIISSCHSNFKKKWWKNISVIKLDKVSAITSWKLPKYQNHFTFEFSSLYVFDIMKKRNTFHGDQKVNLRFWHNKQG